MRRPPAGAKVYNILAERCSTAAFAAEVVRQAPGTAISASGPALPIAADISHGDLRIDYPEVPRTSIRDGIAKTIAFYKTQ